jgi:peptidyl-prolyl cis-trans isomerase A (cyclophilin A)
MTKRIILAALLAAAAPAFAQVPATPPTAPPAAAAQEQLVTVALETDKGRIVLALDQGRAPVTTANFLAYVDKGWLDGQPFYRAMTWGDGGLIQGGVRDGAKQLPPIRHEPTSLTGLNNVAGAVALANSGAGTARNDFYILTVDIPPLDATATEPGFAVFGRVVEGILAAPVSATKGDADMKGQMLEPEVKILRAARVKT